ncbi:fuculose phosphate aldolase [Chromatiales bacterium (ex Bugula neritina AB1)]|nr:fuculose phosphate aldolase [Chromatiales bacterium (ex Bugula neritina AB1)]
MNTNQDLQTRKDIISSCLQMNASGLNQGTSGNISVRSENDILITPTSLPYNETEPEDIVSMSLDGEYGNYNGRRKPSTEWRFHLDTYLQRDDIGAMVHTHSIYATTLSMLRIEIPACHYMVAVFGGPSVRCADYAIFGSEQLSKNILTAMEGRSACLLGTHGMLVTGKTLKEAMWSARELETLAHQYYLTIQSGREPVILDDEHIYEVVDKMKSGYGIWNHDPDQ